MEDKTTIQTEGFPKVTQVVENRSETKTMATFMILCVKQTNKQTFNQVFKSIWIHPPDEEA